MARCASMERACVLPATASVDREEACNAAREPACKEFAPVPAAQARHAEETMARPAVPPASDVEREFASSNVRTVLIALTVRARAVLALSSALEMSTPHRDAANRAIPKGGAIACRMKAGAEIRVAAHVSGVSSLGEDGEPAYRGARTTIRFA